MAEIKTEVEKVEIVVGDTAYQGDLISEDNTISDIARWIIKNDWQDEILYFLQNMNEL